MAAVKRGKFGRAIAKNPGSVLTKSAQALLTRKYTPLTLRLIITTAADMPVVSVICQRAKISRFLLRCWLDGSRLGRAGTGDPFDVVVDKESGHTERFHILFEDAILTGFDRVEEEAIKLATGRERQILSDRGRVQYRYDPGLLGLGLEGEEAYLRDKNGDPIPESTPIVDPEMVRWILSRRRPEQYGNKMQVEHEHKGGVLVVGTQMSREQIEKTFGGEQELVDVEFEEITDDD